MGYLVGKQEGGVSAICAGVGRTCRVPVAVEFKMHGTVYRLVHGAAWAGCLQPCVLL